MPMHWLYIYSIFLLEFFFLVNRVKTEQRTSSTNNQTFYWTCHLSGERRLECRNLFNFHLSSYALCANDELFYVREKIDEFIIRNDYNCFDHSFQCYFEFDSSWSRCFQSLRKLTVENLSFIVHSDSRRRLLPVDYLKIVNTHGSLTDLLSQFQFSNLSSIFIENSFPRWSGIDLYSIYFRSPSVVFKQLWINVYDWYPIIYMRKDQQARLRQWLTEIPCLRIALGDCQTYHHDLIFLRDVFSVRQELSNELYCYENRGQQRFHWSKIPALYYNYVIRPRNLVNSIVAKELHEQCFQQFLQIHYTIDSFSDLQDFYSHFQRIESDSVPLLVVYPYATLANLPISSTSASTVFDDRRPSSYSSKIEYLNIYQHGTLFNETRWLSSIEAYPDGRFLLIDNRNQHILLLNENGSFRIDLSSIIFHQIQLLNIDGNSFSSIDRSYSFANVHIDDDSYFYLIPTQLYKIYIFSPENRLIRSLTAAMLGISILRSDCLAVTQTGLLYVCDDAYRAIRIYTRMGVYERSIYLEKLPFKLLITRNRMFVYSTENLGFIQIFTLAGAPVRTLNMCSFNFPSEVIWLRGKYFLTCGTFLYVIDEKGDLIAEQNLRTLVDHSNSSLIIQDFALNKNGLLLVTFRQDGRLFNRYWIIRPSIV